MGAIEKNQEVFANGFLEQNNSLEELEDDMLVITRGTATTMSTHQANSAQMSNTDLSNMIVTTAKNAIDAAIGKASPVAEKQYGMWMNESVAMHEAMESVVAKNKEYST